MDRFTYNKSLTYAETIYEYLEKISIQYHFSWTTRNPPLESVHLIYTPNALGTGCLHVMYCMDTSRARTELTFLLLFSIWMCTVSRNQYCVDIVFDFLKSTYFICGWPAKQSHWGAVGGCYCWSRLASSQVSKNLNSIQSELMGCQQQKLQNLDCVSRINCLGPNWSQSFNVFGKRSLHIKIFIHNFHPCKWLPEKWKF